MKPSLYPLQRILSNKDLIVSSPTPSDNITPMTIMTALPDYEQYFNITYKSYPAPKFNFTNTTEL